MANKKFYYRNKNKKPQTQNVARADVQYTAQQLAYALRELGISDVACQLLEKNRITTAADLVKRTEKDMYKVQGFNKKMLFELKDALKKADMSFRAEVPAVKPEETLNKQNEPKPQDARQKQNGSSKFGLADRRTDIKRDKQPQQSPQTRQKTEKLTEPLPIESWRKIMKGGKWGFSDGFKTVVPAMYDEVFCFKEGLASVEIDGKCGFIDGENNIVVPLDYDIAMSFSDGLAMVARGEKCGYVNKNNEVIIPFEYDAATPFEDGEAKVKKDGKWATINKNNDLTWI